jgi:prepilin-type N-terminal cleavage/methylation domain-containing protein
MPTLRHPKFGATNHRSGFSLIELVITMTIMVILVGVVSMRATGVTDRARSTKIIATIESLETPVMLYHQDTGQLPTEYSGWQGASYHRLSADPGVTGWDGPYISDPIRRSWNPTGGSVHVFNYVVGGYTNGNGIDLDGDGTGDVAGTNGSIITFWDVEQDVAEKVDRAFDDDVTGNWQDAGKVEYQAAERRLTYLLYSL